MLKGRPVRGVMSDAMLCSEKELGLSGEHEGILILPEDAPTGTPLRDYLGDIGARCRCAAEYVARALDPGRCARGRGAAGRAAAAARGAAGGDRAKRRGPRADHGRDARPLPALHRHADRGHHDRPIAAVDAAPAAAGRDAADQQCRGCEQLCDAGAWRAEPLLRRRQGRRSASGGAAGAAGRAADHARWPAARADARPPAGLRPERAAGPGRRDGRRDRAR